MPRATLPLTLVARVRAWFGLRQAELALYLGVSPALVQHLESGRRPPTLDVLQALLPLAAHLPAPLAAAPPATPSAGIPVPDAGALDFRRRVCVQQAARLRAQAAQLELRTRVAQHWAQALPALLAVPAPAPNDPDRAAWRAAWLHRQARPLPLAAATRWHLLSARAMALEAEAAALAAALAGG